MDDIRLTSVFHNALGNTSPVTVITFFVLFPFTALNLYLADFIPVMMFHL